MARQGGKTALAASVVKKGYPRSRDGTRYLYDGYGVQEAFNVQAYVPRSHGLFAGSFCHPLPIHGLVAVRRMYRGRARAGSFLWLGAPSRRESEGSREGGRFADAVFCPTPTL